MNPIMPCPQCGKSYDFHDDEVAQVKEGSSICMKCGMDLTQANFILEMIAGEHSHLIQDEEEEE